MAVIQKDRRAARPLKAMVVHKSPVLRSNSTSKTSACRSAAATVAFLLLSAAGGSTISTRWPPRISSSTSSVSAIPKVSLPLATWTANGTDSRVRLEHLPRLSGYSECLQGSGGARPENRTRVFYLLTMHTQLVRRPFNRRIPYAVLSKSSTEPVELGGFHVNQCRLGPSLVKPHRVWPFCKCASAPKVVKIGRKDRR